MWGVLAIVLAMVTGVLAYKGGDYVAVFLAAAIVFLCLEVIFARR